MVSPATAVATSSLRRAIQCEYVMYIQTGGVKLSVLSKLGREAVVAMLGPGDFFGEGLARLITGTDDVRVN